MGLEFRPYLARAAAVEPADAGATQVHDLAQQLVALVSLLLAAAVQQGLTLVHFPAQRKRFLWDRGWNQGLLRNCL